MLESSESSKRLMVLAVPPPPPGSAKDPDMVSMLGYTVWFSRILYREFYAV